MDAFTKLFSETNKVTATVKEKLADGRVRTSKLATGPVDMTEEAFADAAATGGATFSESIREGERTRTRNRKDVTGDAARAAVLTLLGYTPKAENDKPKKSKGATAPKEEATAPTV